MAHGLAETGNGREYLFFVMLGLATILVAVGSEGASQSHFAIIVLFLLMSLLSAPVEVAAAGMFVRFVLVG